LVRPFFLLPLRIDAEILNILRVFPLLLIP
jgi:hypothetical protein